LGYCPEIHGTGKIANIRNPLPRKISGDFTIPDVLETSIWVQAALTKFFSPRYMEAFKLKELRREAEGVVNTLIRGLK
tara:strand:+ start:677 stop:910 length:234 start_codon:yes stop_codon:yes gene_type:complete